MNKSSIYRIGGVVLAFGIAAAVLYFIIRPEPLPPQSDAAYVKPEVAKIYAEIARAVAEEPEQAESIARGLEEADPDNAITYYAIAAAGGRKMKPEAMTAELERGNEKETAIHYIEKQPAHEHQVLLGRMREIGFAARTAKDLTPETAQAFYDAIWKAGLKIAQLEPMTGLNLEAGISIRTSAAKAAATYFEEKKDTEKAKAWAERRDAMAAWDKENAEAMKVDDLVRRAADEAGLSTQEVEDARNGIPLSDARKQRAMEISVVKFIEEEGKRLRELASTLPE